MDPSKKTTSIAQMRAQTTEPMWFKVEALALELGTLQALLFNASGEATASFNGLEDDQRAAYLAHCADLASAAKAKAQAITAAALQAARATPAMVTA